VPRLGFCTPAPAAAQTLAAGGAALEVDLWRLEPAGGAADAAGQEVAWRTVGGGAGADGGALYVPAGEPHLRRATIGWRGWPPGTYVFRVRVAGAAPGAAGEAWFAVELRGPWRGPGAGAPDPSPRVPGVASPAPGG
jgi:hypothetical protein